MVIRSRLSAGLTSPTCPSPVELSGFLILVIFKGLYQCETAFLFVPYIPIPEGIPVIYINSCGKVNVFPLPLYYIFKT